MSEACDFCARPACISDGMVGANLCDSGVCLDKAWNHAWGDDGE